MIAPGDVISYPEMCAEEGVSLQRGMNFRVRGNRTIILMSVRKGAPYADRIEGEGKVLIYEGHDVPRTKQIPDPKSIDQPLATPAGKPTENQLFLEAAQRFKRGEAPAELVRVYEKIHSGIWVYGGLFKLVDAWPEKSQGRNTFKFKLELVEAHEPTFPSTVSELDHDRLIPTIVKLEVWKRDKGRCVKCGSKENLHFDHVIPYSKGGSSLVAENIQLLCAKHNLEKKDKIE